MKRLVNANKWWLLGAAWVYTFTFVFNHYWSQSASYETIAHNFSKRIQNCLNDFDALVHDSGAIDDMIHFQPGSHFIQNKDAYYYLYRDSPNGMQLVSWSSAAITPSPVDIPYRDTVKTVDYNNGFYVLATHKLPGTLFTAVQLILVRQEYFVQTAYLHTAFPGFPGLEKHLNITTSSATPFVVQAANQRPLFYLLPIANRPIEIFNWASLLVQIIATLMLLVFIYRVGIGLVMQRQRIRAFVWMVTTTLLIRLFIEVLHFPVNVSNTILFQPVDQPSFLFPSLGGLLLNLLLLIWIVYFTTHTRHQWLPVLDGKSMRTKKGLAVASIVLLLPLSFYLCQLVLDLVVQPQISFDVANFFSLGWDTAGAIACLYFIVALHYRLLHLAYEVTNQLWPQPLGLKLILAAIIGLLLITPGVHLLQGQVFVFALAWLLLTILLEDRLPRFFFYGMERSVRFVFWLIWYGIAATLLVQSQQHQKDLTNKLHLAQTMASHENTEAASLISQGLITNPVKEALESSTLNDSVYNEHLRENMLRIFNRLLSGYTTNIYFFDSTGKGLRNQDSTNYETLNTIIEQQGRPTGVADLYLYESAFDQFQYIVRKPVQPDSTVRGTLFITAAPPSFSTQALMPELFKPLQTNMQNPALYDYALYNQGVLLWSSHNFPFTTILPAGFRLMNEYETQALDGQEVLWYNAGNRRLVAVIKPGGVFSGAITVFAYIFSCFILLYLVEQLLIRLLSGPYRLQHFWVGEPLSIRSKIRRTVILVSILSFVLIGIATVYFFIHRYQQNNNSRLTSLVSTVEKDLRSQTDITALFRQPFAPGSANMLPGNSATVTALADLLGIDINLFDLNGNLTATSQQLIYNREYISTKMNPVAFYQVAFNHQSQYLQTETIGQLTYQGVYLPVRSAKGATLGFINIPYFASQVELNQEISNFLVTLINLIAFISIIAGILAFFITNSITTSFFTIGQKMKAVSLGSANEPIQWNHNDEIGVLVQQYNKMLEQLDESARKLATSERENAWREMAKQVAHEIKNPLTPMKLSLQYLQRQLENDAPNVKQAAAKTATMLVEQIDHLSQIASDFSQLARINVARVEKMDLQEVLSRVVMLYRMDSHFEITWQPAQEAVYIEADRTQINRLFTNLIKNAGEAVEEKQAIINISKLTDLDAVTIAITDNGPGIPADRKPHLFTPSFTTKSSGSGLGLAICKDIVERAGGTIWFQSNIINETTFFIRLPIAKS